MVKQLIQEDKTLYLCEACGAAYPEKEWAEKCQAWCEAHGGTCNIEIIAHSVPVEKAGEQG
ncbi:MAG: hypothetical protein Q8O55_04685 [Dehalococcoidales bacterium]|nr:hypothetical protein [Dehalococcoidales bacterium]